MQSCTLPAQHQFVMYKNSYKVRKVVEVAADHFSISINSLLHDPDYADRHLVAMVAAFEVTPLPVSSVAVEFGCRAKTFFAARDRVKGDKRWYSRRHLAPSKVNLWAEKEAIRQKLGFSPSQPKPQRDEPAKVHPKAETKNAGYGPVRPTKITVEKIAAIVAKSFKVDVFAMRNVSFIMKNSDISHAQQITIYVALCLKNSKSEIAAFFGVDFLRDSDEHFINQAFLRIGKLMTSFEGKKIMECLMQCKIPVSTQKLAAE